MGAARRTAREASEMRGAATRLALIERAEALFAQHGIEGVSLRQIGLAGGSANASVVAYHFGNREALVQAILAHRLEGIEARRGELLAALSAPDSLRPLLEVLWRPLFEQTDSAGRHSYARFLGSLIRSGALAARGELHGEFPLASEIWQRIAALLPPGVDALRRQETCTAMLVATLDGIDRDGLDGDAAESAFAECLTMIAAALAV